MSDIEPTGEDPYKKGNDWLEAFSNANKGEPQKIAAFRQKLIEQGLLPQPKLEEVHIEDKKGEIPLIPLSTREVHVWGDRKDKLFEDKKVEVVHWQLDAENRQIHRSVNELIEDFLLELKAKDVHIGIEISKQAHEYASNPQGRKTMRAPGPNRFDPLQSEDFYNDIHRIEDRTGKVVEAVGAPEDAYLKKQGERDQMVAENVGDFLYHHPGEKLLLICIDGFERATSREGVGKLSIDKLIGGVTHGNAEVVNLVKHVKQQEMAA